MNGYIKTSAGWNLATNVYVKTSAGWKKTLLAWVKTSAGWKQWFGGVPTIASPVTMTTTSSTYPATLSGTNYHWTNGVSYNYGFQSSPDNATWTTISTGAATNPGIGGSNTNGLTLGSTYFTSPTMYFRYYASSTNTLGTGYSYSSSLTVTYPAPTAAGGSWSGTFMVGNSITFLAGAATNYNTSTVYIYRSTGVYLGSVGGTSIGYTLTSADVGYTLYGYSVVVGYGGTTTSPSVFTPTIANYPAPTAAAGIWAGTTTVGSLMAYNIGATTNATSVTTYMYRSDGTFLTSTTATSGTLNYTIASGDVGFQLYAYTVASGLGGTATSSSVYTATITGPTAPSTPGTPTLTYISANTTVSWNYSAVWGTSTGTAPITYYLRCYGINDGFVSQLTLKGPFSSGSSGTFTLPQTNASWEVAAYATNPYGTSGDSAKSNSA